MVITKKEIPLSKPARPPPNNSNPFKISEFHPAKHRQPPQRHRTLATSESIHLNSPPETPLSKSPLQPSLFSATILQRPPPPGIDRNVQPLHSCLTIPSCTLAPQRRIFRVIAAVTTAPCRPFHRLALQPQQARQPRLVLSASPPLMEAERIGGTCPDRIDRADKGWE